MTKGIKAFGTKLYIGDGNSPEQYTKIDECFKYAPIGGKKALVNFSNHDSIGFEEYQVEDLKDGNELPFEANKIPRNTSQGLIRTADANSSVDNYMLLGRDFSGYQFPGIVMSLEDDYSDMKGRVVFRFSVKICGAVTPIPNYSPAP